MRVGILGATGYAGVELVRLLLGHPEAEIVYAGSRNFEGRRLDEVYPSLRGITDLVCSSVSLDSAAACDVVFTALPHGVSGRVIPTLYAQGARIIDLSGDYRYLDPGVYEKWYGTPHSSPELLKESVYGLPELHRAEIAAARLVGNPGCYTTCSILGLAPLIHHKAVELTNIIVDAKSGVTGAGRTEALDFSFCEMDENMKAYKLAAHRHTSEIEQEFSLLAGAEVVITFSPHLLPVKRGILSTIYAHLAIDADADDLVEMYKEFYRGEFFVRVCDAGRLPETKNVNGSNFADIGLAVDKRTRRVIVVSAVDNLIKGAAGQAVQNMNALMGLDETLGLAHPGYYL